jgi:hypothetical protein
MILDADTKYLRVPKHLRGNVANKIFSDPFIVAEYINAVQRMQNHIRCQEDGVLSKIRVLLRGGYWFGHSVSRSLKSLNYAGVHGTLFNELKLGLSTDDIDFKVEYGISEYSLVLECIGGYCDTLLEQLDEIASYETAGLSLGCLDALPSTPNYVSKYHAIFYDPIGWEGSGGICLRVCIMTKEHGWRIVTPVIDITLYSRERFCHDSRIKRYAIIGESECYTTDDMIGSIVEMFRKDISDIRESQESTIVVKLIARLSFLIAVKINVRHRNETGTLQNSPKTILKKVMPVDLQSWLEGLHDDWIIHIAKCCEILLSAFLTGIMREDYKSYTLTVSRSIEKGNTVLQHHAMSKDEQTGNVAASETKEITKTSFNGSERIRYESGSCSK